MAQYTFQNRKGIFEKSITKSIITLSILLLLGINATLGLRIISERFSDFWGQDNTAKAGNEIQTTFDVQFQTTTKAGIALTGNTLMLSPRPDIEKLTGIKTLDFGDTFISLDQTLQDEGYPRGTTREWRKNGSSAVLEIPENSEILHAQLIWSGMHLHTTKPELNLTQFIDYPISFSTPEGSKSISGDPRYAYTFVQDRSDVNSIRGEYVRTADVTDIVKRNGSGLYSVGSVPALISREIDKKGRSIDYPDNFAGWSLAVAYRNENLPIRNVSIFTGLQKSVAEVKNNLPALIQGFGTPPNGELRGKLFIVGGEGDGVLTGDEFRVGKDIASLKPVRGINNPETNFFNSLILDTNGEIDDRGTFGTRNHSPGITESIKRQGWDIASVDLSSYLENGQTSLYIQGTSKGDGYNINLAAIEIEVFAPTIETTLTSDKSSVKEGDVVTFTTKITNRGVNKAQKIRVPLPTPSGTVFIPQSVVSPQISISPDITPQDQVIIDNLNQNETVEITYQVRVYSTANINNISNHVRTNYSYQMVSQGAIFDDQSTSGTLVLRLQNDPTILTPTPIVNETEASSTPITPEPVVKNQPPIAENDFAETTKNNQVQIQILANDFDMDFIGNNEDLPVNAKIIVQPLSGTATIAGRSSTLYIPNPEYIGDDSFTYEICDEYDACDTAIVSINIKDTTNQPPQDENEEQEGVENIDEEDEIQPEPIEPRIDNTNSNNETNDIQPNLQPSELEQNLENNNSAQQSQAPEPQSYQDNNQKTQRIKANDDNVNTRSGETATINLIANDQYNSQDGVETTLLFQTTNGEIKINDEHEAQYTPLSNFIGLDTAVYQLCTIKERTCSQAKISISVTDRENELTKPLVNNRTTLPRTGGNPYLIPLISISSLGLILYGVKLYTIRSKNKK